MQRPTCREPLHLLVARGVGRLGLGGEILASRRRVLHLDVWIGIRLSSGHAQRVCPADQRGTTWSCAGAKPSRWITIRRRARTRSGAVDGRVAGCPAWQRRGPESRRSSDDRPRCARDPDVAMAKRGAPHDTCGGDPRSIAPRSSDEIAAACPQSASARHAWDRPQGGFCPYPSG